MRGWPASLDKAAVERAWGRLEAHSTQQSECGVLGGALWTMKGTQGQYWEDEGEPTSGANPAPVSSLIDQSLSKEHGSSNGYHTDCIFMFSQMGCSWNAHILIAANPYVIGGLSARG